MMIVRAARAAAGLAIISLAAALMTGCGTDDGTASGRLKVATTVAPITSIAAAVAGDRAEVEGIVPEGTNSHTFEPAPRVAELVSTADVIFVNGLKLEEPTEKLAEQNKKSGAEFVELGTTVLPRAGYIYDFSFPKKDGKPNPHLWTDPTYAIKYAQVIRDTLSKHDPANASAYAANYAKFETAATALAGALRSDQGSIPAGQRKLLTYHDAYAYFAQTFGWTVIGAVQPKNFEDPAAAEVARLIDQIRAQKVRTIFGSEVFPSRVLAEIGRATGARYEDTLRDDDLPGKPGQPDHSWLGLMRYDYITMIKGLGGTTPHLQQVSLDLGAPDKAVYPQ
jgi:ABC-type Zn uptake system ZnuABC Zn-binding protein ZnuA